MVYTALLRGINVGGNNKIDMKLLKKAFEQAGMNSVVTYINSGNIIFTYHGQSKTEISLILQEVIHLNFGLQIKVVVLNFDDMNTVANSIPESWTNDQQMRTEVMFLWDEVNSESVLEELVIKPDIDTVKYVGGAILWSVERKNVTRSGMNKLIGSKIYRQMTIRNVNTTRKIFELMQAAMK
ncbi:DUF1697 domain-containing protein [Paenibacillus sp. sptzw28]|uniref:DUF1697 domain-containing protein n=1 Tax=Paenibacillus sp. sptzw28 TaxID=715179 RepID=UPI001C6E192F|nr:DUF1697 domain-containing protein [Paenibacillus sp. sptzw28]QYR19340.1 DUF1697 domain-containing protein [Paenibacillus sp. sptzw28]